MKFLDSKVYNKLVMRYVIFIFAILVSLNLLFSQEKSREKKNIVFLELYGAARFGGGMGYERYFRLNELFRYSLRGGLSYDPKYKQVPMFLGNSLMFGKRHNIEMGFNFMIKHPEMVYPLNSNVNNEFGIDNLQNNEIVSRRNIFNFLLGYRYQNEKNGFMLRVFLGTPIKHTTKVNFGPHVGASAGLSF